MCRCSIFTKKDFSGKEVVFSDIKKDLWSYDSVSAIAVGDTNIKGTMFMIYVIVLIIAFIILYSYVEIFIPFNKERQYIKMEINRSCSKQECNYWKKEMKKLYRKSIPIIRWFVK